MSENALPNSLNRPNGQKMPKSFIDAFNLSNNYDFVNGIAVPHLKLPFERDSESYYWLMLLFYKPFRQPIYAEDAIECAQPIIDKIHINKSQTAKQQCQIDKEMLLRSGAIFDIDFKLKIVQINAGEGDPFNKSDFRDLTIMNSKLINFLHANKLQRLSNIGFDDIGHPRLSIYYKPSNSAKLKLNRAAILLAILKDDITEFEMKGRVIVIDPYNILTVSRVIELMKFAGEIIELSNPQKAILYYDSKIAIAQIIQKYRLRFQLPTVKQLILLFLIQYQDVINFRKYLKAFKESVNFRFNPNKVLIHEYREFGPVFAGSAKTPLMEVIEVDNIFMIHLLLRNSADENRQYLPRRYNYEIKEYKENPTIWEICFNDYNMSLDLVDIIVTFLIHSPNYYNDLKVVKYVKNYFKDLPRKLDRSHIENAFKVCRKQCYQCYKTKLNDKFIRFRLCGQCRNVRYCNVLCQKLSWNVKHRYECNSSFRNSQNYLL